uniref:uncharacterized protein LOC122610252 n=1 Tax=Erigeron canadensis TaxID=72917 RepID=UPI001CB9C544|nr:uncharacterized protein LOC122610252 [Erigeron canadensis]
MMASGSIPPSSSKLKSVETPGHGVKSYDFLADSKWWLYPQPIDSPTSMWESSWEAVKSEEYAKIKKIEAGTDDTSHRKLQDDYFLATENPDKLLSEMDPQLIGINKTEPWWRTSDVNDLASFVSSKSLEKCDKFDPPQPHTNNSGQRFVPDKGLASLESVSDCTDSVPRSTASVSIDEAPSLCGLHNPLSTITPDDADKLLELSKAELLEALCHSQTRAREAEIAAKQAYNEKEHVITHFLKQASHLFAYKQWLHILQLETACFHLNNSKRQLVYTRFSDFVPWVPTKDVKRVRRKAANSEPESLRDKISRSLGNFILGLTLVGAGLLLGWTLGWLSR